MKRIQFCNLYILMLILFCINTLQSQNPYQEGEWGAPISFGIVPVAVANLPDGRLITWSSQYPNTFDEIGDGMTYTELFDPNANGGLGLALGETVTQTDHDMFCPGINNLADGRILSAGGTTSERTSIYDPTTNIWSRAADMNIPRGYQGNVTLSNGAVFTVGGSWSGGAGNNGGKAAELWTPESGWVNLSNISGEDIYTANDYNLETQTNKLYRVDNHVWLWPSPDGKLFHAGPSEEMHWINPDVTGGTIISAGLRGNPGDYDSYSMKGTTVMFDIGKILKVGGATSYGESSNSTTPAKDNSYVIDINAGYGQTPTVTNAGPLAESRTMHNSTVLPNGQVLVTGGLDRGAVFTDNGARYVAELYTPSNGGAGTWETVAAMQEARTYHSVAILMTDGRVFVGGGGLCDGTANCVNHFSAEIYSPPYLFNSSGNLATRPVINTVPQTADYDSNITVTASAGITEFSLIRFSAATHSTNNEQRRIPLTFSGNGTYNVVIPNRNLLPPGYYMLFAIDANGTPSVSKTVRIGSALPLQIPNSNLVVDMKFEDGSGSIAEDSSMYNNNATIVERDNNGGTITNGGNYNWTSGIIGDAIEFNGLEHSSNALIDIPSSASLQTLDDQITVMAWAYRNSAGSTIGSTGKVANVGLFSHDYVSTLFFGFHNTMYKWAFVTNNGPVDLYAGRAPMDTWVHLAATYDGTTAKLYANGKLISWKALSGTIPFKDDSSLQSHFTSSGFYDERTAANLPSYANGSGITDEINGKIDELKVFNKVLGESEIKEYYLQGINTGNPNVVNCATNVITVQYKIGAGGGWITGNSLTIQEGAEVYLRAAAPVNQYYITTPQENGPTFDSGGSASYEYKIDTGVYAGTNPERSNGFVDISNQGQFVLTTSAGCTAVFDLKVTVIDETDGCPNQLINEDSAINLPKGTSNDLEISRGTPFITNGSGCALELSNTDINSPNVKHNIALNLNTLGIVAGDEIFISLDAESTNGIARFEAIKDDVPNQHLLVHSFPSTSGWSSFSGSFIVPNGLTTINLWLFTNYQSNSPGTVIYDNLTVINLSNTGGNIPPSAVASSDVTSGTAPLSVNFDGSASTDSNIATYLWNFGNGVSATGALVSYTYPTAGNYVATLTVTDTEGLSDTDTINISVSPGNIAPVAVATSDVANGTAPLTINFDGSGSIDSNIATYSWDFGNGVIDTGNLVSYTYPTAGNFVATLTVTDTDGLTDTDTINISVSPGNVAPVAVASSDFANGTAPLTINFDGSGSTDSNIATYSWDFGNGDTDTGAVVSYTYPTAGNFITTLTVTDTEGLSDTDTININVSPAATGNISPVAVASSDVTSGTAPLAINFDGSSSTDSNIATYSWDFGNGDSDTGALVSYIYPIAGNYITTLTVTDTEGLSDTDIVNISVSSITGNTAPVAVASADTTSGSAPLTINFDASDSSDDNAIDSFTWNFGDGSVNGSGIETSHTYTEEGVYEVILTVTDEEGLADITTIEITVSPAAAENLAPIAIAIADPLNGASPLAVNFDASASSDDIAITSYSWNFGDGSVVSTGIETSHTYETAGIYNVVLTVTDAEGLTDTIDIEITVATSQNANLAPVALAIAYPLNGETPLLVTFDASGSSDDKGIKSYAWDYGDGITGNGIITTHTFSTPDTYEVTLVVTDEEGLTDTTNLTITVTATNTTLNNADLKNILVYPNPVGNENLNINLSDFMNESIALGFYDSYGKLVFQNIVNEDHPEEIAIDVSFLSNGLYLIEITRVETNEFTYKKIIKGN